MNDKKSTYAQQLLGRELAGGWEVMNLIERETDQTGGYFSTSYTVKKDGKIFFLKAMDYVRAFESENVVDSLEHMTAAYIYERDLLKKCTKLSRIVKLLNDGQIQINEDKQDSIVQYLIFELAEEGDIRSYMKFEKNFDEAWSLRTIHSAAVALRQLHSVKIAHQDLKPSNMIIFKEGNAKLTDLGRASDRNKISPHDHIDLAGDKTYAPPELLYGHISPDWNTRRLGCDMYLLGSLIVFIYMGVSVTHLLLSHLSDEHKPIKLGGMYTGVYDDVLIYVENCFTQIIRELRGLQNEYSGKIADIVKQLCNPNPVKRGDPINIRRGLNQYNLERYITAFDLLARKAECFLIPHRNKHHAK